MKRFAWGACILFFLLCSLGPTFFELSLAKTLHGRTFEPVHNYITDYHFYLSRIRQGMEGRWSVVERYTSEPHGGSLLQIFYVLLGKPASFFSDRWVGATVAYHTARVVFGLFFLSVLAVAVRKTFGRFFWQIIAFLLIVTASSFPILVWVGGWPRLGGPMSWWTVMDSLQRITFLPHILLGQTLILLLVADPFGWRRGGWMRLFLLFFFAGVLGIVFPPGMLFIAFVFIVEFIVSLAWGTANSEDAATRAVAIFGGLPPVFYTLIITRSMPWIRLVEFDRINPTRFSLFEYVLAVGPVLIFGLLGMMIALIQKDRRMAPFISWTLAWLGCMVLFQYMPGQSPLRFTEMAPQVGLGVLSAYFLIVLSSRAEVGIIISGSCLAFSPENTHKGTPSRGTPYASHPLYYRGKPAQFFPLAARIFRLTVLVLLVCCILQSLCMMYSSYLWQRDFFLQKAGAGFPAISMNNLMVYPSSGFTEILRCTARKTVPSAIILSDLTAGNYIPAYTGRTVYVGHDNTYRKEEKLVLARMFFRGAMDPGGAQQFLHGNNITHIFFGPQEKELGADLLKSYPFLIAVCVNADATLFRVGE